MTQATFKRNRPKTEGKKGIKLSAFTQLKMIENETNYLRLPGRLYNGFMQPSIAYWPTAPHCAGQLRI